MTLLSDNDLLHAMASGELKVAPFHDEALQPASIDVRLGDELRVFENHRHSTIDPLAPADDLTRVVQMTSRSPFVLHPGEFVLAHTCQRIELGPDLAARVEGRSSLGRLGLLIHSTAGFIDPGFRGQVTLELSNASTLPILLRPGMGIGQLCVFRLSSPAARPYGSPDLGSRYQGQAGPTASRGVPS